MATRPVSGFDSAGNPITRIVDDANLVSLIAKARTAIDTNNTSLGHAAIPAGTLTTAQLSTIVREQADQIDALTRQNTALMLFLLGQFDDIGGT